jgi:hypothetical protein
VETRDRARIRGDEVFFVLAFLASKTKGCT